MSKANQTTFTNVRNLWQCFQMLNASLQISNLNYYTDRGGRQAGAAERAFIRVIVYK